MQKNLLLFFLCLIFSLCSHAQLTRYIVKFRDKNSNPFSLSNPSQYLSQRAIDRRLRYNIAIDSADLPVTPGYIDSLRLSGNVTILNVSKWLNQVAIQTTDAIALNKIANFPFVLSSSPVASKFTSLHPVNKQLNVPFVVSPFITDPSSRTTAGFYNYGESEGQVKIHHTDFLHNHGFRGEGMIMTVLDAGFYHYLSLPTFDSIRNNNQVLGTWDFVDNEASVDEDYYHGMQCLSTIAANMPGTFVGTAPKTSFYLFRTEDVSSEYPIEEQNWAAGAERADSLGADLTSTSLGYTRFDDPSLNYTYSDMDGNTTISAQAADWAAKKGMLVVSAAGNEGNNAWHFIATPSDADSTLCVGAVNVSGDVGSFSSYGPSSDGQTKPSVAAVGWNAVVANLNNGQPSFNSGTSFACPNMAGVTACLWQAFQEINNMGIINALEMSATKSSSPDDRVGFGIPDVKKAFVMLQKLLYTKQFTNTDCNAAFQFTIKTDNSMYIDVERKLETETTYATIATLQNSGNYGAHDFSYNDDISNISPQVISYRLKMSIASDTTFYLDSVVVNHAQNCNGVVPSNDVIIVQEQATAEQVKITVKRISPAKINIVIHDAAGQKVYRNESRQQAGTQIQILDLRDMLASRGMYFLSVYIDNKKVKTKQIIRP